MSCKNMTKNAEKKALMFRQFQLLSMQHRSIYSKLFFPIYTVCIIIIGVICTYNSIITLYSDAGSVQLGLSLLYLWVAFHIFSIIIFVYGILADVYKVSNGVLEELKTNVKFAKSRWFKRFVRTCPIIRIYIFGTNFIDELTPLNLENFVVDQTVSLLLLN